MFVYGTVPKKKPEEAKPEPVETKVDEPPPSPSPPPPPPSKKIDIDAEVEYFRQTLKIRILWLLLWIQLGLWITILICQIIIISLLMAHKLPLHDDDIAHTRWLAGISMAGPLVFFIEAWILSVFTLRKPRGCILGTAMGFQAASAVVGLMIIGSSFFVYLISLGRFQTMNEQDQCIQQNTTNISTTTEKYVIMEHKRDGYEFSIAIFSAIEIIACLFYMLSCCFILALFCGGACCGSSLGHHSMRLSGSPILTSIKSGSVGSLMTSMGSSSTASLNALRGSQFVSPPSEQPHPSQQQISGDGQQDKTNKDRRSHVHSITIADDRDAGLYLNLKLIRILLIIQTVCTPMVMVLAVASAGLGDVIEFVHLLIPISFWASIMLTFILFGLSIGLTWHALERPGGHRVGVALAFQVISAVIGCWILMDVAYKLYDQSSKEPVDGASIALMVLVLLFELPVVVCSCNICLQFCLISCCGRYKVNAISYCDIEYVILSEYERQGLA